MRWVGQGPESRPALRDDGQAASLASCNPSSAFQKWVWNTTGNGYLSNDPGLASTSQQCLNVYGCGTKVVYWSCVTTGGTCCGEKCYKNLQWSLEASGALVSWLSPSLCATANANGRNGISLAPCSPDSPASNQQWSWDPSTGLLRHTASGLCLAQPIPTPPRNYVQICSRVTKAGWNTELAATPEGYCLVVGEAEDASSPTKVVWTITAGTDTSEITPFILASGTLDSSFDPASWHSLNLTVQGSPARVFCTIDGVDVVQGCMVDDRNTFQNGLVLLGSGYHEAWFDDFYVGL